MKALLIFLALAACDDHNDAARYARWLDPTAMCDDVVTTVGGHERDVAVCHSGSDRWVCISDTCWVLGEPVRVEVVRPQPAPAPPEKKSSEED